MPLCLHKNKAKSTYTRRVPPPSEEKGAEELPWGREGVLVCTYHSFGFRRGHIYSSPAPLKRVGLKGMRGYKTHQGQQKNDLRCQRLL